MDVDSTDEALPFSLLLLLLLRRRRAAEVDVVGALPRTTSVTQASSWAGAALRARQRGDIIVVQLFTREGGIVVSVLRRLAIGAGIPTKFSSVGLTCMRGRTRRSHG